jgi:hypothetical protein
MCSVNSKRRHWTDAFLPVVLLTLGILGARIADATTYRCTSSDGEVSYRETPCAVGVAQEEVTAQDNSAQNEEASVPSGTSAQTGDTAEAIQNDGQKDCSNWEAPPWTVEVTPPVAADLSSLPKDDEGHPIISHGAGIDLVVVPRDKPDAMSILVTCSAMLTGCYRRNGDPKNSMDACFNSAPRCTTARPWEEGKACCPESCWQKYSDLRRRCVDPLSAQDRVLFAEHCVPGVADMLQGRQQPP